MTFEQAMRNLDRAKRAARQRYIDLGSPRGQAGYAKADIGDNKHVDVTYSRPGPQSNQRYLYAIDGCGIKEAELVASLREEA